MSKTETPLISVITPYYKAIDTILQTIESVRNQTFQDWEMIIVDDHSGDDIESILSEVLKADARIQLIVNTEAKGVSGARNTGLVNAIGRYVAFLDSDDLWTAEKLEKQVLFMQQNDVAFSYGNYMSFSNVDAHGIPKTTGSFYAPPKLTFRELSKTCSIGCLTVMLDTAKFQALSFPYSPKEDYALWLQLTKHKLVAHNYGGTDAYYRISNSSYSSNKFKEVVRQYQVIRRIGGLSILQSIYAISSYVYNGLKKHKNYRSSND